MVLQGKLFHLCLQCRIFRFQLVSLDLQFDPYLLAFDELMLQILFFLLKGVDSFFQFFPLCLASLEVFLVVRVNSTNLLTIVVLQIADDIMMICHHMPRPFEFLQLLLRLSDFLVELLDDADEPLESGYYFLEGRCDLLLAGSDLRVD